MRAPRSSGLIRASRFLARCPFAGGCTPSIALVRLAEPSWTVQPFAAETTWRLRVSPGTGKTHQQASLSHGGQIGRKGARARWQRWRKPRVAEIAPESFQLTSDHNAS